MKKNNFETQPREISEEELAAAIASLGPIEVPEGPLTNAGEQGIITTHTITADELSTWSLEKELLNALGEERLNKIGREFAEIIRQNKLQHDPVLCRKLFYWLSSVVDGWNCV